MFGVVKCLLVSELNIFAAGPSSLVQPNLTSTLHTVDEQIRSLLIGPSHKQGVNCAISGDIHIMSDSNIAKPIPPDHFFKSIEIAEKYDTAWGSGSAALAAKVLSSYQATSSLKEGQVFHDNACGTGIVTREILSCAAAEGINVKIEATDIAEPMLNILKGVLSNTKGGTNVNIQIMDGQVYSLSFFKLIVGFEVR